MSGKLTIVAVGLIALGAVAMAGPTLGFSTIASDRGVNIATADDPNALLGINETYDGTTIENQPPSDSTADVLELVNNFNQELDTIEVGVASITNADDNTLKVANKAELYEGLGSEESKNVELECSGDVAATGTEEVTITILNATGPSITVEDKPAIVTIDFDCREDDSGGDDPASDLTPISDTDFQVTDARAVGDENSVVEFEITNTNATSDATITKIEVRSTSSTEAEEVDDVNGDEVVITGGGDDGTLNVGDRSSSISIGGDAYPLDDTARIDSGQTAIFTLTQFQPEDTGPPGSPPDGTNMVGEDVTVVIYLDDGRAVEVPLEDIRDG